MGKVIVTLPISNTTTTKMPAFYDNISSDVAGIPGVVVYWEGWNREQSSLSIVAALDRLLPPLKYKLPLIWNRRMQINWSRTWYSVEGPTRTSLYFLILLNLTHRSLYTHRSPATTLGQKLTLTMRPELDGVKPRCENIALQDKSGSIAQRKTPARREENWARQSLRRGGDWGEPWLACAQPERQQPRTAP